MSEPPETGAPEPPEPEADAIRAGDPGTFDALVRVHARLVRGLVRRYLRTDADADDACQLAFARAFERRASFRGDAPFRTWLCRIAVTVALDLRDKTRPRGAVADVDLDALASFTNALETSKLVAAELWRKAEVHLATLPPKQRLVVELRLFHDLSFKEIGVLADCSEASARVNFAHGVGALRAVLGARS